VTIRSLMVVVRQFITATSVAATITLSTLEGGQKRAIISQEAGCRWIPFCTDAVPGVSEKAECTRKLVLGCAIVSMVQTADSGERNHGRGIAYAVNLPSCWSLFL
jgi:hypothetical protein